MKTLINNQETKNLSTTKGIIWKSKRRYR